MRLNLKRGGEWVCAARRWMRVLLAAVLLLPLLPAWAQTSTTTTLSATPNPSAYGQAVTLTATVTGSSPAGSVTFADGGTPLGSAALTGSGNTRTATFSINALTVGSHSLTTAYPGDVDNAASTSSALAHTVNKASTTSGVSSSANPSTVGQTVTWAASVTGVAPTGTVTFRNGTTVLGTATLAASGNTATATYASSALAVGSHSMTVVYAGDANNNTSTSAGLGQTVNKRTTTTALSSSANPSTFGQTVTWTATISGGFNPSGAVTFKDGTAVLGTATVAGGSATYTSASLAGGSHSMTAVYAGDANNNTSTSAALSQTVSAQTTSVSLSSSANPAAAGQTITLTASVSGSSPTGTVTFFNGATALATRGLSGGTASFATALAAGSYNLTASYGGNPNNAASTSSALALTVGQATTTLTLTASPSPAVQGQNVTLVAQVNNSYVPSGTVTFSAGATVIGTASVTGGAATIGLNSLTQGSHSITAAYAGDANNTASSSGAVSLTVGARSGMVWQYGYDAMGRMNTVVDPNALPTYYYYDSLGRRIQTQEPPNTGSSTPTVTQFGWNLADGLTSVTDPKNLTTSYTRNGLGDVPVQSSPDTNTTTFTYDANGNILTSTDARGKTTAFAYDNLDRLTSIAYPTGTGTTFEYDGGPSGTASQKGELTKITDESGQTVYAHDALGRLIGKTVTIGTKTFTVSYSWGDSGTAMDKLTAITYPSGSKVNYSYDAKGGVSGITVNPVNPNGSGQSATAQTLLSNITYNADNNITGWQWSDGKARSIGYDGNGLVSSYTLGDANGAGNAAGVLRTVTRDAAGRITGYTHTNNGNAQTGLDQSFGYDNLNRLLTATIAGTSYGYSYDENGNRTSKTIGGTTYTNTIASSSNRLTQVQDVGGTAAVTHDAAGNITADGTNSYGYSDRGRMGSATTANGAVTYSYNGLEQRARKSSAGGTSYYVYDEAGQLLGEYDGAGKPLYETIYLGSMPAGVLKQTGAASSNDIGVTVHNAHADHIDTVRMVTKQDHTVMWRWDTAEAFGATVPNQDPSGVGAFVYNPRFPGQVFDQETGLNQNWHREYSPRMGRYVQSDPIGLAGGVNSFAYAEGNPMSFTDLYGLFVGLQGCSQIRGAVTTRSHNYTDEKVLYSLYRPGLEPVSWGFGPDIDPRAPRRSPIKPEFKVVLIITEIQRMRFQNYRRTEFFQAVVTICRWKEKDRCGAEREHTTASSSNQPVGHQDSLISERLGWKERTYFRSPEFGIPF
jgi:RHS repeat-associated protein